MQAKLEGDVLAKVLTLMKRSASYHLLLGNHTSFAREIAVSEVYITELGLRVNRQAIPLEEVPKDIIHKFVAEKGSKATVESIHKALINCGLIDIAESLEKSFPRPLPSSSEALSAGFTNQTTKTFNQHGREISLKDVKQMIPEWIPNGTVLHGALHKGMVQVVKFLLPEAKDLVDKHFLLHSCVRESAFDEEIVIQDKITIIQYLFKFAKQNKINLLDDEFEEAGSTPILQPNIHLDIFELLLDFGANINSCTRKNKTILHQPIHVANYKDILRFAIENKFNKFNYRDSNGLSPLHFAIQEYGVLENSVLQIFKENGSNFNAVDNEDYSILFYALRSSPSLEFVDALIQCGANINHVTNNNLSAIHVVIEYAWNAGQKWEECMININHLVSKGFDGMFRNDLYGLSPYQYMIHLRELGILFDRFKIKDRPNVCLCDLLAKGNRDILEKILKSRSNNTGEKVFRLWLDGDHANISEKIIIQLSEDEYLSTKYKLMIIGICILVGFYVIRGKRTT